MPQTGETLSPQLGIQLERVPRGYYTPGDTICGTVDRKAPLVTPRARVAITLHGRSKSKIKISQQTSSGSNAYYRDNFTFFSPSATTVVLFDGPLHVEAGGDQAAWPFAVTIPTSTRVPCIARQRSGGRTELNEEGRLLPGSFYFSYSGFATEIMAFVEYYLEATMRIYSNNASRPPVAILPVSIRCAPDPRPPIADFALQRQFTQGPHKFQSHRLVPDQEDVKPSSSQKIKRFFHSSKVPSLTVMFEFEAPGVIQLEHPIPVPLLFRAVPVWEHTSEAIRNIPQKIRLSYVSLKISSQTTASAPGTFREHSASEKDTTYFVTLGSRAGGDPIYLPFSTKDPPLDIGELLNLRIGYIGYGGSIGRRATYFYSSGRICPAFRTSNINHFGHRLKWTVRVSLCGETEEISGSRPVRILPPSCDLPPGEPEAPPPLLESQTTESWAEPPPEKGAPPPYRPAEGEQGQSSA
ncbi:hypothetical protein IMZ48_41700 [Candidatus Bathyarchaeota archaeon]|nr:hypothetical protein [Candidatus Bathyarchaeota archaeon]